MAPRMSSASQNYSEQSNNAGDHVGRTETQQHHQQKEMQQPYDEGESNERIRVPQHLYNLLEVTETVTIVSDNAKVPPLTLESPLFRKERGLPPLPTPPRERSNSPTPNNGGRRKKPESRWDSMPQPKRLNEEAVAIPSLAQIRQDGHYLRAEGPASRMIPTHPFDMHTGTQEPPASSTPDTGATNDKPPGLSIPRRRESFDMGKGLTNKEGVSLLSQVLDAFDLSDEEDEAGTNWMMGIPTPPPSGRFMAPPVSSFATDVKLPNDVRSTLSPESSPKSNKGAGALSIPVRRESIDSMDIDFALEDLQDFFSDDEDTEHADQFDDSCGEDGHEEDSDSYFGGDESSDKEQQEELEDEDVSSRDSAKDDSTLISTTTATSSTA